MSLYYDETTVAHIMSESGERKMNSDANPALSNVNNHTENDKMNDSHNSTSLKDELGFSLEELFQMARQFLKGTDFLLEIHLITQFSMFFRLEKQGTRATPLKYQDNVRFSALLKQATIGKWHTSHTANVGLLDVVGNDRK